MKVIDLCSGLGGGTQAFKDRGHEVFTTDIHQGFNPDLIADVRELNLQDFPFKPDFIWASPPCTEFTKWNMPWYRNKNLSPPDMSIVESCIRLIKELEPKYWVLENVRGSVPYIKPLLGNYIKIIAFHYIWGEFPIFYVQKLAKRKDKICGAYPELRSLIPYELSLAVCKAIERENGEQLPTPAAASRDESSVIERKVSK